MITAEPGVPYAEMVENGIERSLGEGYRRLDERIARLAQVG
jgi:hypothetical protein